MMAIGVKMQMPTASRLKIKKRESRNVAYLHLRVGFLGELASKGHNKDVGDEDERQN